MKRKLLHVHLEIWTAFAIVSLVFAFFPQWDLDIAGLFYTPGAGFEANGAWYERLLYKSVSYLLLWVTVGLIILWLYNRFSKSSLIRFSGKDLAFLLLFLALGPGLLVNEILKENWGRARPVNLVEFGGAQEFTPAFVISDQGGHSFCSGHAAAAFYLILVAWVLTRGNKAWMGLAIGYGLLVGLIRMAAGGHFLSDILTSIFLMLILSMMLHGFMLGRGPRLGAS